MNSAASEPALIGIDWGTSSLRAFLIGASGEVIDRTASSQGIMHVPNGDFETVFTELVSPWIEEKCLPVLASGMITSRNGWIETPYEAAPLDANGLARSLVPYTTRCGVKLRFVTGVTVEHESGPDVIRGEETQIIGASALGMSDGIFVMPGTHSKWITVANGSIVDYATYMTGEVFAALKDHTILGALIEDSPFNALGFEKGVLAGLRDHSNLLHSLFLVRTLPLMGKIEPELVADYLSGLLIGAEIAAAAPRQHSMSPLTIIGRSDLADRYTDAFDLARIDSQRAPDDIVAMGHFLIARSAGLLP